MKFLTFRQAEQFLFSRIPTQEKVRYQAGFGLERTVEFLKLLGSPQNKLKVIHVAGTSGKGSTAYLISHLLVNLGFKVGLHVSPHLLDIRERFQINNKLISEQEFIDYLNQILPAYEQISSTKYGFPTYFEICTALSFYISFQEKVDYQVAETGVGGLFDATNSVDSESKIAVLTKIGLDHIKILGNTIAKIALQKAEIIHQKNLVICVWQRKAAREVIEKIVADRHAKLSYVKGLNELNFKNLELGMPGKYQEENAAVALTAVKQLSKRDSFEFNEIKIRQALKNAYFAGRMDIKNISGKQVILDGAHNPQKMRSFIASLKQLFPNQKFNFLVAFKKGKDYLKMLEIIRPHTNKIFATEFFKPQQDWVSFTMPAEQIDADQIIPDTTLAFKTALQKSDKLVVTGSLYLLSDIYKLLKNV